MEVDNKFIKRKRIILISIIACIILFFLILVLMFVLQYQSTLGMKININGTEYKVTTAQVSIDGKNYTKGTISLNNTPTDLLYIDPDNTVYFSIETMCDITGYKYNRGEYNEFSESKDKCYVETSGEIAGFDANSKEMYKVVKADDSFEEIFENYILKNDIKKFNDKLFAQSEAINIGFNTKIINKDNNISIFTLPTLISTYEEQVKKLGYDLTSENFKNKRTMVKDLVVVSKNKKYGVYSFATGEELISTKYDSIEYIENINSFVVEANEKVGMISADNPESPTLSLDYDSIKLLDAEKSLFIVEKNSKFGVVNEKGESIVYTEYDEIGIPDTSDYTNQSIKNKYLLFNNCIPLCQNGKYGFYCLDTGKRTNIIYDSLGYKDAKDNIVGINADNVLTVTGSAGVDAIVVSQNGIYGLISSSGKILLPVSFAAIYSITEDGNTEYYVVDSVGNYDTIKNVLQTNGLL